MSHNPLIHFFFVIQKLYYTTQNGAIIQHNHCIVDIVCEMIFCTVVALTYWSHRCFSKSCIQCIHIGFSIVLYINHCLLFCQSQYRLVNLSFSFSHFVLMWKFHIRLWSKCMPQYFTQSLWLWRAVFSSYTRVKVT